MKSLKFITTIVNRCLLPCISTYWGLNGSTNTNTSHLDYKTPQRFWWTKYDQKSTAYS